MNPKDFFAQASLHHVPPRRRSYPFYVINHDKGLVSTSRTLCTVPFLFPWMTFGHVRIADARHALVYLHDKPWEEIDHCDPQNLRTFCFNERAPCGIGSVCLGRYFDYHMLTSGEAVEHYFWSIPSVFMSYEKHPAWANVESIKEYVKNNLENYKGWPNGITEIRAGLVSP